MRSPERRDEPERAAPFLFAASAALAFGVLARLFLVYAKPLWADEIFTLDLARKSLPEIFRVLRADSGPPLHYLLAKLVLLPFPRPGQGDVAVRALSAAASLLSLPLLFAIGKRLGGERVGLGAGALFALSPLACDYAAEGRGYAVASLLLLAALLQALRAREDPTGRRAVLLGLTGAAAVLTHYLALFPLAGFAWLLRGASARARRALLLAAAVGGAAVAPWLSIALTQPRASMAWTHATAAREAWSRFAVDLALGLDPQGQRLWILVALSIALLVALAATAARGPLRELAGVVFVGLALLTAAQLATGSLVLPERTALPFLPLLALLFAGAPLPLSLPVAVAAFLGLAAKLPASSGVSPGEALARALVPAARSGTRICAVGLWGPELDYRLRAAGLQGAVLFPSDVQAHRGWYVDEPAAAERYRNEANELASSPGPGLFVLPYGSPAADALRQALVPRRPIRALASPFFEVVSTR